VRPSLGAAPDRSPPHWSPHCEPRFFLVIAGITAFLDLMA